MPILKSWALLCVVACALIVFGQDAQEARLMRFPDIYKDKVVFMYGGDVWLASTSGGVSRRIRDGNCSRSFRQMANGSRLPASTTAISMCTSYQQRVANRSS